MPKGLSVTILDPFSISNLHPETPRVISLQEQRLGSQLTFHLCTVPLAMPLLSSMQTYLISAEKNVVLRTMGTS